MKVIRVYHCRFTQGSELVRIECSHRLREWMDSDREFGCEIFKLYVSEARSMIETKDGDAFLDLLISLINVRAPSRNRRHKLQHNELILLSIANASPSILPLSTAPLPWAVPHIPQLELARQITLNEYEIFCYIRGNEFFNNAWNGKHKNRDAPNLTLLTNRFNKFAAWISTLILAEKTAPDRAHIIQYFIIVQRHLFNLNNFNAVLEIHAVLSSSHIARLQASWKLVPRIDLLSFSRIDSLVSPAGNYREYRKLLLEAKGEPCIPYLGAWLTDLTYLAELSTWIDREEENLPPLLNILKLGKISAILKMMREFQTAPYPFSYQKTIGYYLMSSVTQTQVHSKQAQEMYERSLLLEPRNPNFKERIRFNQERGRFSSRSRMATSSMMDVGVQVTAQEAVSSGRSIAAQQNRPLPPSESPKLLSPRILSSPRSPRFSRSQDNDSPRNTLAPGGTSPGANQSPRKSTSVFAMPKIE